MRKYVSVLYAVQNFQKLSDLKRRAFILTYIFLNKNRFSEEMFQF